jgi:WD40 repeat protein
MLVNDIDEHDAALQVHKLYDFRITTEDVGGKDHQLPGGGARTKLTSRSPAPKKPPVVTTLLYHPATKRLYVGLDNGELRFWKLGSTSASLNSYLVGVHKGAVSCVFVPHEGDGDLGAAGLILSGSYDATIKLWDYVGKINSSPAVSVQTLYGHGGTVTCMVTNGGYIITGSTDCTIRLWRAEEGRREVLYPWFEQQVSTCCGQSTYTQRS